MKELTITLEKLFKFLNADTTEYENLLETDEDIFIKTPEGSYSKLRGVIRKIDDKVKITTLSGKTLICGNKHILVDGTGNYVYCKDATDIQTMDGVDSIVSKEYVGTGDVYDVSIDEPHLYVTPNGIIHHNTTFLRGLIHHAKTSATVTYDPEILNKDSIFADFIDDDECNIMVLEDADTLLMARKEGNSLMQRFLNVGDGLVTSSGKKLIFSTNLESTTDIDPALLRPGRLFDIVQFELLTKEQAQTVAKDFNIELNHDSEFYSIAEIFHDKIDCKNTKRKFGFI